MNNLSNKQKNKKEKNIKIIKEVINSNNKSPNNKSLISKFSKNNMLVAVRTRPLSKSELDDSNFNTISVPEKDVIKLSMPTEYIPDDMSGIYLAGEQIKILKVKEISYEYDFVFGENTTQEEVYENTTANLIKQVVEGYSATIMAYGATGSGKTYTMVGKGEKIGLMIRAIRDLFNFVKQENKEYNIKISYIEVYNEVLKDLLSEKKTPPEIRTDPNKGVIIQGAECIKVSNEKEAFKLINLGNKRRTEKQTDRNIFSSRSHAILQIYLEIQDQKKENNIVNINNDVSFGKLYLVDLAGSEKTSASVNTKSFVETGSINKSLLALSKCINLIVSQNKKFIPFRESKLTRILQEPLSGNGRIVLIATLSPAVLNFDETMFTLQFANRAKCMKIHMKKNVVEGDKEIIDKYEEYIKNLREEINVVENEINVQKNNMSVEEEKEPKEENKENEKVNKLQNDMVKHFKIEIDLRKKMIEEEEQIEQLKNDLNSLDYEMIHKPKVNMVVLNDEYQNKKKEIEKIKQKINEEYIKENELISQRRQYKNAINELNINNSGNFQIINLFHIYKYYTNLLENMSNEHRKNINLNEMQRKENKISLLNEQLDLRDLFIDNAKKELNKNNISFNFYNPNIATKEEIDLQEYDPLKLKADINDITKTDIDNNIDIDISKLKNSYLNRNERFNEINKINKKLNISSEKNKDKDSSKNIFKRNISSISKKNVLINAGNNLLKKNNFGSNSNKNFRSSSNQKYKVNNTNSFYSYKFNNINNVEVTNTTRLENEIQKKVKTILNKDFIGRYKRSPYLKIFNQ